MACAGGSLPSPDIPALSSTALSSTGLGATTAGLLDSYPSGSMSEVLRPAPHRPCMHHQTRAFDTLLSALCGQVRPVRALAGVCSACMCVSTSQRLHLQGASSHVLFRGLCVRMGIATGVVEGLKVGHGRASGRARAAMRMPALLPCAVMQIMSSKGSTAHHLQIPVPDGDMVGSCEGSWQ